jgi:hypothetical protein
MSRRSPLTPISGQLQAIAILYETDPGRIAETATARSIVQAWTLGAAPGSISPGRFRDPAAGWKR